MKDFTLRFLIHITCLLLNVSFILKSVNGDDDLALGNWMNWSPWTHCTEREYCLEGTRERSRQCEVGRRCVGIEAESEMCPRINCKERQRESENVDIKYADIHSFIAEECSTTEKYLVTGKYSFLMKHNITKIFSRARNLIKNSYFNVKITPKILPSEKDIYRYCFEPISKEITLEELRNVIFAGSLRLTFTSLQCALKKPVNPTYVSGFVLGFQSDGAPYGIYIQLKDKNGFKIVYYKHMSGRYSDVYNLIWS